MSVPDSAINVFGLCPKSGFNKFLNCSFWPWAPEKIIATASREFFVFGEGFFLFLCRWLLALGPLQFNAMLSLERERGRERRGGGRTKPRLAHCEFSGTKANYYDYFVVVICCCFSNEIKHNRTATLTRPRQQHQPQPQPNPFPCPEQSTVRGWAALFK